MPVGAQIPDGHIGGPDGRELRLTAVDDKLGAHAVNYDAMHILEQDGDGLDLEPGEAAHGVGNLELALGRPSGYNVYVPGGKVMIDGVPRPRACVMARRTAAAESIEAVGSAPNP